MDLQEWDVLSDDGFFDLHEDGKGSNFSSSNSPNTTVIDMNYFQRFSKPQENLNSMVIPVPIQFDYGDGKTEEIPEEETTKFPIETAKHDDQLIEDDYDHQDTVSQVFFKKLKENEFADMKLDSPRSLNRGIMQQIDVGSCQFKELERKTCDFEKASTEEEEEEKEEEEKEKLNMEEKEISNDEGMNVWKWAMNGIGAVFSFGFAAVTISLIVLGNRHKDIHNNSKEQDLHFQFYTHNKRVKHTVRGTTRFNEAITVTRGDPVTRAHITIGGYYDGL